MLNTETKPQRPAVERCALSRQVCRHTIYSAALPGAHAEVLCRRRQRYKYVSVVERPQQRSHQQLGLVEGISPRGLTYLCTEKAGYINSARIWCTRSLGRLNFLDLLLRHNALVGGHPGPRKKALPDVKTGRGTPRSLYTLLHLCMSLFCLLRVWHLACFARCPPKVQSSRGRRNNLTSRSGNVRALHAFPCSRA